MSDTDAPARDESSGQFTSAEPLFGKAREEADQGFKPMVTAPDDDITFDNAKEAGDILAMARQDMPDDVNPIEMQVTATGEKAPANETMSVEQAALALTAYRDGQNLDFAKSLGSDFAAEIDKLRGDAPAEEGEQQQVEAKPRAETPADAEPKPGELDAEIAKALKHPQVREAVEQELGKAAQAHQQYSSAVDVAQQFAVASFMEQFPELAQLSPEHLQQGLEALSQVNPERFDSAMRTLTRVSNLQQEQMHIQQQQQQQRRQELSAYKDAEWAKFQEAVPNLPKNFGDDLRTYAAEIGVNNRDLQYLMETQPFVHSAPFQRMLHDAVMYRNIQKAKGEVLKKPVPTVLRPGVSRSSGETNSEHMNALSARLAKSGSLKDAQALRQAQIRSRG